MIRSISFEEVLSTEYANGPLTLQDYFHARRRARTVPDQWISFSLNTKGARVEIKFDGRTFKHRLDGYAADGSDIKPLVAQKEDAQT